MSDMDEVDTAPALMAFERTPLGTIVFAKTVPQCHTCTNEWRPVIEEQYVMGRKAPDIIELLEVREGGGIDISEQSMNRHFTRGHCTTPAAIRLMPQWKKAAEEGLDPHDFEQVANTSVALIQLLVEQIKEEILSGKFDMDAKDRLAVLRMNYEMEQTSGVKTDFGANEIYIAVSIFMAHVQAVFARFCPMDQVEAMDYFRRLLSADPIIKSIIEESRQYEGTIDVDEFDIEDEGEDIHDAEIVTEVVLTDAPAIEYSGPVNEEDVDPTAEWEPLEP